MANSFRTHSPARTCTAAYKNYQQYKSHLRKDFNRRCGYTDCPDFWFGGTNNFHIDHFIPWKNYPKKPNLKTDYSNLVYTNSYVNILKSNDEGNYIDPCDVDYNLHFTRDDTGCISPVSSSAAGNYMYKKLKLFMRRYQIIWMLDQLFQKMETLKSAIESTPDGNLKTDLLVIQGELGGKLIEYIKYLKGEQ